MNALDKRHMATALSLAARGLGRVAPNPAVGCVIAKGARVLGRGWTQPGGRPHAESVALDQARNRFGGDAIRGATAYVSLEPCAHHGRTPPCANALVDAGIARVVCPLSDPDPRVDGSGFEILRAAGVKVEIGVMADDAAHVNAGFLHRLSQGRPHVALKMAATLDGRIATATGESRWITGPEARRRAHLMRARSDAVLIGAGTARADDPMLDVRGLGLEAASPIRVVADPMLSLEPTSRLARSTENGPPLWLAHGAAAPDERRASLIAAGADLIEIGLGASGKLDIPALLAALGERDVTRLMCEGGGRLAAALLLARAVDEIVWFSAGAAIGAEGLPALGAMELMQLPDAPRFRLERVERIGADVMSVWRAPRD